MNPLGQVPTVKFTREGGSSYSGEPSMAIPRAMEGLHGISPPPFLTKTCDLIDDPNTNHIVAWSKGNNSFIVWDPRTSCIQLLPKYFKHFIRQLNTYGFRKVDPDKLEFANEWFLRGQRHLLKNIKRGKTPSHPQSSHQDFDSCVEVGQFGLDSEIDHKLDLMVELVKLRQEQQNTKAHLKAMEHRLKGTEMKQHQITGFLARMIQNSSFVQQLVKHDRRKEFVEAISNKRRKAIDQGLRNAEVREFGQGGEGENYVKLEPQDYSDVTGFEVLEQKTMNMQNPSENLKEKEERQDGGHRSLDKGFWEELLNDGIEEGMGLFGVEAEGEEVEVDMLVEQLGFMDSSPRQRALFKISIACLSDLEKPFMGL